MGKLDVSHLQYLKSSDIMVLNGVENGMKNHELVPGSMVSSLAKFKSGGVHRLLQELCQKKLLSYERGKKFDGYRLTNMGYDYIALHGLVRNGILSSFGHQIGVGKESNIYIVTDDEEKERCLKIHRLGRTCFRSIVNKRDYHKNRIIKSWLYLSRISAKKEFAFMKALYDRGFPIPKPIECNRHCVVMELIPGTNLSHVREVPDVEKLYDELMDIIVKFGNCGLIHGDFNEFNIMLNNSWDPIIIDFPQMMSTSHPNAKMYFERDVKCIVNFFKKRFGYESCLQPEFSDIELEDNIDIDVQASGFTRQMNNDLNIELQLNCNEEDESSALEEADTNEGSDQEDQVKSNEEKVTINEETDEIKSLDIEDPITEELCQNVEKKEDITESKNNEENNACQALSRLTIEENLHETDNNASFYQEDNFPDQFDDNLSVACESNYSKSFASCISDTKTVADNLRKNMMLKKKKLENKRIQVKGEANAVVRKRRENKINIKDSGGIWGWE